MDLVKILLTPKKFVYLSLSGLTILILALLLVACGDDTSKLEVITAPSFLDTTAADTTVTNQTTAALTTTGANATTVSNVATTAPVATTASVATTSAATTKVGTTSAATTKAGMTSAATTKAVAAAAIKPGVLLEPMVWESQTMNNCAPVSAEMVMSYYGIKSTQQQCAKALRPNTDDKHVRPEELANFLQKQGLKTVIRENGSLDKLRALLSAGIPVITQQWLHENDDIGHYRVARGYDQSNNTIVFNDSMDKKAKTIVDAALQDKLWKGYDRRYMPVYTAKQEATVMAILGEDAEATANQNRALAAAKTYADANPKDIDAWRNLGYLNYAQGDCKAALVVWEQKLTVQLVPSNNGPYNRFLWYQLWPIECYNKVGNYQQVIKLAPNEIEKTKSYAEARYEFAVALSSTGRKDEAIAQLKKGVLDDPNYSPLYTLLAKLGVAV